MITDGLRTPTVAEQQELESRVAELYSALEEGGIEDDDPQLFLLDRQQHAAYVAGGLGELPAGACRGDEQGAGSLQLWAWT